MHLVSRQKPWDWGRELEDLTTNFASELSFVGNFRFPFLFVSDQSNGFLLSFVLFDFVVLDFFPDSFSVLSFCLFLGIQFVP